MTTALAEDIRTVMCKIEETARCYLWLFEELCFKSRSIQK